jgi:tRNA-2-methylthio-N6-dimethylallyladenosine synthase
MKGSFFIKTWGCQMNVHDSEKICGILAQLGCTPSTAEHHADLILLNTCSVREKSYQKVFSYLGKIKPLKEKNPDLIIGVCGCVAQQEKEQFFRKAPFIDFLMGPRSLAQLEYLIEESRHHHHPSDLEYRDDSITLSHRQIARKTFPKAYLTIMEGCNRKCSYCIVPQTRGREVYRPFEDILAETEYLSSQRFIEIELLGQNVTSYQSNGKTFHDLLHTVSSFTNISRMRFTTSHPAHLTEEIMQEMKTNEKICNNLHLPVQSGSSKILNFMNRGYTREDFITKTKWLKQYIKSFTLSTDIIVGFPGETQNDFQDTLSLMEEVQFDQIYSFAYSPRPNTASAQMRDEIPRSQKLDRLYCLQEKQNGIQKRLNEKWIGEIVTVLVDGQSQKDKSMLTGRTASNKIVNFKQERSSVGKLINVKIKEATLHSLIGRETKEEVSF